MTHQHDHCKHEDIKYCAHCDVTYCKSCEREWGQKTHITWDTIQQQKIPYTPPWSATYMSTADGTSAIAVDYINSHRHNT